MLPLLILRFMWHYLDAFFLLNVYNGLNIFPSLLENVGFSCADTTHQTFYLVFLLILNIARAFLPDEQLLYFNRCVCVGMFTIN